MLANALNSSVVDPSSSATLSKDKAAHSISQARPTPSTHKPMHVGSSKPHAVDGDQKQYLRADRWAPAGSLRQLEPELASVLSEEPMPITEFSHLVVASELESFSNDENND